MKNILVTGSVTIPDGSKFILSPTRLQTNTSYLLSSYSVSEESGGNRKRQAGYLEEVLQAHVSRDEEVVREEITYRHVVHHPQAGSVYEDSGWSHKEHVQGGDLWLPVQNESCVCTFPHQHCYVRGRHSGRDS